jgi:superfamily II DNA or RNA helicase
VSVRSKKKAKPRELRPYQSEAVDAVHADWANGTKRVGVVLPTGAGKSTVIGKLVSDAYHDGHRIVCLAHRGELLDQMRRDLIAVDPSIPLQHMGMVRAEMDDHHAPIVFATLQTLATAHRRMALGKRDVIIWDEVHHAPALGYHATFTDLGGYDDALMCGFTATMYRSDNTKGKTVQIGLGDVIQKISYEKDLRWAIENEYLVPPTGLTVRIGELNALDKVKNIAGDFHQGDLADIMEAAVEYTVDAIEMHARDRRSIVFAASVEAARQIADLINERGVLKAVSTTGAMTYDERQPVYHDFRNGDIDVMVTVMVLTEGADFPMCDCVVMARPTRSRVLYSQMVGRALRLYENKTDALVLDLAGTARSMKLIHLSELVHGMGLTIKEVDEDGEEILCDGCGMNLALCVCEPEEKRIEVRQRQGTVDMVTVNLLDDDDTLWLETPAGVPFVPLSDGMNVFVWPNDDRTEWAVGSINTKTGKGAFADVDLDGRAIYHPLATALRKAEEWVIDNNFVLPSKFAQWRTRNQGATEKQMGMARRLQIVGAETFTRGRLSDEISIALMSRTVDHNVTTDSDEEASA